MPLLSGETLVARCKPEKRINYTTQRRQILWHIRTGAAETILRQSDYNSQK